MRHLLEMKRFAGIIALVIALVLCASSASAHKFVLSPDNFAVPRNSKSGISVTFTEIIGSTELSLSVTKGYFNPMTVSFDVIYIDGTSSDILSSDFKPSNDSGAEYVSFDVAETGTVIVRGKFNGIMDLSNFGLTGTATTISHVKTFLNLSNDGMATKRLEGSEFLEVVFADEVPSGGVRVGDAVRFKFFLNGQPLRNAPVFASYAGAPIYEITEDSEQVAVNDYLETTTDDDGAATFKPDSPAPWFVGAFDATTAISYGGGILFNVSDNPSPRGRFVKEGFDYSFLSIAVFST
ncbi:MAG: DUF4198 domain-containing protein [Synergistaceae bacterium]|nr:DUF4198 domain-containing protein [Synergistaceae bacterium]